MDNVFIQEDQIKQAEQHNLDSEYSQHLIGAEKILTFSEFFTKYSELKELVHYYSQRSEFDFDVFDQIVQLKDELYGK